MKKVIAFVILSVSFVVWCPSTHAQWEGAEIQRLTHNDSPNELEGFYIDKNDKLFLFYHQHKWDPDVQPYRDTLLLITKERGNQWSQPEKIGNSSFDAVQYGKHLGYDPNTGIIHIVYTRFMSLAYDTMYYTNSQMPDWQLVKIDSLSNEYNASYQWLALEFDSLGNVHLIWNVDFDSASQQWYRVMYANNSTGEWVKYQVSPPIWLGGMGSGRPHLAVQKNGTAHIVYYGEPYCDLECQAFYATNDSLNSTNWTRDTLPKPSRPLWHYWPGPIEVDVKDTVHLITGGCTEEYCGPSLGKRRSFYYFKEAEDSIWIGPELILDSLMYLDAILIDAQSVPNVTEWDPYTYCWFFTDRRPGFWQPPYRIFDTTSMCNAPSSIYPREVRFVLDSQGGGHAVFSGSLFGFMGQDDSLEIYYYGPPFTSVEDTSEEQRRFSFELFQNFPNPFNRNTLIRYSLDVPRPKCTVLKLYNILGKEVRELVNTKQAEGNYKVIWDGRDNLGKEVASGIYFCILRAGEREEGKKMLLIK